MKKSILHFLALSAFIVCSIPASAQPNTSSGNRPSLDFMKGTWEGTAWKTMKGGKETTSMKEVVQCKLGCDMYIVDGLGTRVDSVSGNTQVVHEAFGVLTLDKVTSNWMMRAFTKYGEVESVIKFLDEKTIQWTMELPDKSIIYYTTDFNTEDTWHEIGEMSRDGGATKFQIMDMTLHRIRE